MGRITEDLIRKRSEHNEGILRTLEELSLHQQSIEKIELLGHVCRHLKILYLQNNLIGKIENLHRLKELEYLNLALNNISKVQNLQGCESLKKLDLTVNFISKAGLLTVQSLVANALLQELFLLGNPCTEWHGYRQFVIATLPKLTKLDGQDITPTERIKAKQAFPDLLRQLHEQLRSDGIDPAQASLVEDDSLSDVENIPETGYIDENGELRRPWCAATRLLEHRENERLNREADERKASSQKNSSDPAEQKPRRWDDFPPIEGDPPRQRNEGKWAFTLGDSCDEEAVVLDVEIGQYLDVSQIKADVQPRLVRLLIKGQLLQLNLPCEVRPDKSVAQRSKITGHLVITLPKEAGSAGSNAGNVTQSGVSGVHSDITRGAHGLARRHDIMTLGKGQCARPALNQESLTVLGPAHGSRGTKLNKLAPLTAMEDADDEAVPPL